MGRAAAPDASAFIAAFEGDQRAVADCLFAETVQRLPSELYEFLLSTCLPEQLSVDLAAPAELSGRPDAGTRTALTVSHPAPDHPS